MRVAGNLPCAESADGKMDWNENYKHQFNLLKIIQIGLPLRRGSEVASPFLAEVKQWCRVQIALILKEKAPVECL